MLSLPPSMRHALWLCLPAALLMAGCGGSASTATSSPTTVAQASSLQALVASSDLSVGVNRFTFGLLDNNHPVFTPSAQVTFFYLQGNNAIPVEKTTARFNYFGKALVNNSANSRAVQIGGVYVAYPTFDRAGNWGIEVKVRYRGKVNDLRTGFPVLRKSVTPPVGSLAPRSNNPTVAQMPAAKLDSGRPPDDMHKLSIAQAIAQHRPLVVLFATAAYCTSRMCGPQIEVVQGLEREYRGKVNFVHIEIYQDATPAHGFAKTVLQWHLHSEPWTFVVNRQGVITAKFEGPTPASELRPAIQATLRA